MRLSASTTNAQVLDNLMFRLGNRTSAELRARTLFELNNRIDQLELGPTLPWFLETEYNFATVSGTRSYALPSTFIRETEDGRLVVSQSGVVLGAATKVDYDALTLESGQPTEYALYGERLYFGGVPDGVYNCTLGYFAESADVADNGQVVTNTWLKNAYDVATLHCLRIVAQFHIQDPDMAGRFISELKEASDRFWRQVEARKHAGRSYQIED